MKFIIVLSVVLASALALPPRAQRQADDSQNAQILKYEVSLMERIVKC